MSLSFFFSRFVTEDSKLFVSVMAGVTLKTLSRSLSHCARAPRVIRAHPNTPATVGCGCAVYSMGECEHFYFFFAAMAARSSNGPGCWSCC